MPKSEGEEGGLKGARMQNTNLGGHGHARTRTDISHLVPNRLIPPAQHPSFLEILVRSISVLGLVSFVKECHDCQGSMEGRKEGTMVATVKILPSQSASVQYVPFGGKERSLLSSCVSCTASLRAI